VENSRHWTGNKKSRNYLIQIIPTSYLIPKPRN